MAILEIDGIGEVEVDDGFLKLPPDRQAAEVDAIAASIKGGPAPAAARTGKTEEELFLETVNANQPKPDTLAARGSILPVGRTKEGDVVPALPGFLEGPRQTIMDLIEGKRTASQISGKEMFELGSLFAGSPAGSASLGAQGVKAAPAAAGVADDALRAATPDGPPAPAPAAMDDAALAAAAAAPEPAAIPALPPGASTAELKTAAQSFYKAADDAGVVIKPTSVSKVADDIRLTLDKAGLDPTLHPRATAAFKRVQDVANGPLTFERLEILRRVANAAGKGMDKDEGRVAGVIVDKIDEFVGRMGADDVVAGNGKAAAETITKARELWSKVAKLEKVEDLVDRARISAPNFSGSGLENALRTEFRALAKNKREMRTFTVGEQKAIKRIAKGTGTSNVARAGGKLAPTGIVSGALSSGLGATIGTAIGIGPVAGAAIATSAGFTARALATRLTQRHVTQLETLIRNGGDSAMAQASLSRARATLQSLSEEAAKQAPRSVATGAADTKTRR